MVRGTTPLHVFTLPFDTSLIKSVKVIYAQRDVPVVKKTTEQCTLNGNTVAVRLSQEDTLAFSEDELLQIQLRVLTTGGEALASKIIRKYVGPLLENEVLL